MSIAGPCLIRADILATAAFGHGPGVATWLRRFPGYEGLVVSTDGALITTPGLQLA